jgi:hypothetical protein
MARPNKTTRKPVTALEKANTTSAKPSTRTQSKSRRLIALLTSKRGTTIQEMMGATNWQAHSVRGFLAGPSLKRHGLIVSSQKTDGGGRRYRAR